MKRFGIISAVFLAILVLIFILGTSFVKRTSYYEEEYFKNTQARIDSIKHDSFSELDSIEAGFAKVSITPSIQSLSDIYSEGRFIQVPLAGFGARKGKYATGVHDSIFVKAVALRVKSQMLVLISTDLLIMPPNITDTLALLLSRDGIKRSQLFFSATHSHSSLGGWASGFIGDQFAGNENKNIQKWIISQVRKAVNEAVADLSSASIAAGSFNAGMYTRNRVIGEAGTKNDDFTYIVIEQSKGKKAILGSFSAHATTMGADNMEFSADYPGYWERKMETKYADVALFFAGSVGSQSPVGKGEGFERSRFIGESLADSIINRLPQVKLNKTITLSSVSLKVQLPEFHVRITTKINLSSWLSSKLMPLPENVYFQALRIGNMLWITTPCDFSGEYALQIKNSLASQGFRSFVTSFNGSYIGYVVPGRYFYKDSYESKLMGWFGPNMGDYAMDLIGQISKIVMTPEYIR
jgi:neutral ceramidase